MGAQRQQIRWSGRAAAVVVLGLGWQAWAESATRAHAPLSAWDAAEHARMVFEAQPKGRHTQADYTRLLDRFRSMYHDDPASVHAGRAVEQVAELLAEQGHELDDRKSLHDAARQYEFLAKGYPAPSSSPRALGVALELLGPDEADDPAEARKVREVLLADYPSSPAARSARTSLAVARRPPTRSEMPRLERPLTVTAVNHAEPVRSLPIVEAAPAPAARVATVPAMKIGQPATPLVTGIRHWSTGSYTRVVIDLGEQDGTEVEQDVAYQAVRVQHPDRIFFDLQHVNVASSLVGKSFAVTDGGLLNSVRAAQLPGGDARVVLDVQGVAKYSAFLLPNPERLIIDVHGDEAVREQTSTAVESDPIPAPVVRQAPPAVSAAVPASRLTNGATASSLPPTPVTDGSAAFGLPPRTAMRTATPQPLVVIPTRPTAAKPVPNTVTKSSSTNDVAAVSDQPGRVAATSKPTSLPVASSEPAIAGGGDHYHPRTAPVPSTSQKRDPSIGSGQAAGHLSPVPVDLTGTPVSTPTGQAAPPTTVGDTTLMRALGLKIGRIVIDAGHGGHDSGTLGAGGIQEKDVVLDVALRLGKLLHDRLGAEIVYTRADDTFIPLETRTAIANKAQADLFISVHANSSPDESARGVEVYYLNFTSDPDAMNVASRENAVSTQSVHELSDLVKKIALKDKIDESRELAADVDSSLYAGLRRGNDGLKDRGVKKAPFVVLIGANMPSILAEISFVTNPDDADQLETPEYRERVAESLYKGVAKYAVTINHTAPARPRVMERAAVSKGQATDSQQ